MSSSCEGFDIRLPAADAAAATANASAAQSLKATVKDSHKYDKEVREAARCRGAAARKVTGEYSL